MENDGKLLLFVARQLLEGDPFFTSTILGFGLFEIVTTESSGKTIPNIPNSTIACFLEMGELENIIMIWVIHILKSLFFRFPHDMSLPWRD